MIPRCNWLGGCGTILRQGNTTGICGAHQKALDEARMGRQENLSRRKAVDEARFTQHAPQRAVPVKRVIAAAYFFYGVSGESDSQDVSFAKEVAIFLLKYDLEMSFESISFNLKCEREVVQRSYHKIKSWAGLSPDHMRKLAQIRTQYRSPA